MALHYPDLAFAGADCLARVVDHILEPSQQTVRYRIVYSIEDDRLIVYVVKVGHRSEVYCGPL